MRAGAGLRIARVAAGDYAGANVQICDLLHAYHTYLIERPCTLQEDLQRHAVALQDASAYNVHRRLER